ncbi:fibronectin type III domain-containing protein [Nonomuraea sp. CA-141351]|uniref:fibronectin type III domain-containing protein n=1 Tax=Nonomuraea sp. CA-141351 TaxID=3239996 RepID=UPI003D942024
MINRWLRFLAALALVVSALVTLPVPAVAAKSAPSPPPRSPAGQVASQSAAALSPAAGQYFGARVSVLSNVSIAAGATMTVKVTGVGTVPAIGVSAVAINIAAKGAGAAGGLIVYPSDLTAAPAVTGTRYRSGVYDDGLLIVKVGSDGQIKVQNTGSSAAVVYADIHGYFTSAAGSTAGATYVPLDTARVVSKQTVAAGGTSAFTMTGTGGIPATGVAYVVFHLIVKGTASSKVIAYPSGTSIPSGSDIDYRPSSEMSNLVIAAPGSDGKIAINNDGTAALTVYADVAGYFAAPSATTGGSAAVPVTPARITNSVTVAANGTYTVSPLGAGGVPATGVSAVAVNLTAKGTAASTLRVYPSDQASPPSGGSIVYQAGDWWSNQVPVKLGADGKFVVRNAGSASVTLAVDTFAYFKKPVVPSAPTGVTATAGDSSATVSWIAPADGGAPITGYTVTASPGGAKATTTGATTATVTGLTNGTAYTFTVTATNAVGTSAASASSAPVTPRPAVSPPGPPLGVTASPGDGSAVVTWRAPSDGGSPITGYTVTASPGGAKAITTGATTATVTGLTNGTAYTFTVTATNAVGTSAASAPSDPVTPGPATPPGKPFVTDVQSRDSAVEVTWTPPDTGATGLTEYFVTASPGGATLRVSAGQTSTVLGGLSNGTAYTFTVTAVNAAGTGDPSWPSDPVVPVAAVAPLKPVALQVFSADQALDVQWAAPLDGGSPITGYTVTVSPGSVTVNVPAGTTVTRVTGLTNGTAYTVSVVAANAAGTSEAATADPVTPAVARPPGAPTHIAAAASENGSITLSWQPPIDPGTSAITGYTVTANPGGKTVTSTSTSATVTGLTTTTAYTLTVTAANAAGVSPLSEPTDPLLPAKTVKQAPLVLSNADLATLRAVHSDGTLVFEQPPAEIAALAVGTILYGPVTQMLPQGFLGRVSQITKQNGLFVVTTTPAALADVYATGDMWLDVPLDNGDLTFVPTAPGVRVVTPTVNGRAVRSLAAGEVSPASVGWRRGSLILEVSKKFESGGKLPMSAAIEAQGQLTPHAKFHARLSGSNPYADFGLTGDFSFEARGKIGFAAEVSPPAKELGYVEGPCFAVAQYTVMCVRANVKLKFEADGSVGVTYAATWERTVGVKCHVSLSSSSCDGVNTGDGGAFKKTVQAYGDANITVSTPLDLQFLIDHIVGPAPTVTPYLQLKADTTQDPWWELRLGAKVGVALDLVALEKDFSPFRKDDLMDYFVTLAAGGPYTGLLIVPQTATTSVRMPYTFHHTVSHLPDDVPVQWSIKDDTSATIDSDGTFLSDHPGTFVIRATTPASGTHDDLEAQARMTVGGSFGAPLAPTIEKDWSVPTVGGVAVSWQPPTDAGASPISGYVITAQEFGTREITTAYAAGDATHQLLQGLTPGVAYIVTVLARNGNGVGLPSEPQTFTPLDVTFPGPPSPRGLDLASSMEQPSRPDSTGSAGGMNGGTISGDGRYIVFITQGRSNLMPHDSPYYHPASRYPYIVRRDLSTVGQNPFVVASIEPDGLPSYTMYTDPLISRDGNVVAYTGFSYNAPSVQRGVIRDIAAGASWATEDGSLIWGVSDNGQAVIYTKGGNLYRQAKGAAAQQLTTCTGSGDPQCPILPPGRGMLSGDGNRVVWSTYGADKHSHSWLYDASAGTTKEIFPGSDVTEPTISGDGQKVALVYTPPAPAPDLGSCLVVMPLGGAAPTTSNCLVKNGTDGYGDPVFLSKDGHALAYRYTVYGRDPGAHNVTSLRTYVNGATHIAGGSSSTWPAYVSIGDHDPLLPNTPDVLVYALWQRNFQTSTSSTETTVPGLWLDFASDTALFAQGTGAEIGETAASATSAAPARPEPLTPKPIKVHAPPPATGDRAVPPAVVHDPTTS